MPAVRSAVVAVPVTTLWVAPDLPRPVDVAIVADEPDAVAWLAALDAHAEDDESGNGRLGLHGRVNSQVVAGEPVQVVGTNSSGGWARVVAPWQPSPRDPAGYPGWVPATHLGALDGEAPPDGAAARAPEAVIDPTSSGATHPALDLAREHLGLRYLWGGLSPLGLDCSGLVHHTWRRLGVVAPRDAHAQAAYAVSVGLDDVEPGDLYFFARRGRRIHHVGIVVAAGRMLHASETGGTTVEEDLGPKRLETLVAAGRLPRP